MMSVPHIGFIVAAYAVTTVVVGGLVVAALLDGRALRRALKALDARGAGRRTEAPR